MLRSLLTFQSWEMGWERLSLSLSAKAPFTLQGLENFYKQNTHLDFILGPLHTP